MCVCVHRCLLSFLFEPFFKRHHLIPFPGSTHAHSHTMFVSVFLCFAASFALSCLLVLQLILKCIANKMGNNPKNMENLKFQCYEVHVCMCVYIARSILQMQFIKFYFVRLAMRGHGWSNFIRHILYCCCCHSVVFSFRPGIHPKRHKKINDRHAAFYH